MNEKILERKQNRSLTLTHDVSAGLMLLKSVWNIWWDLIFHRWRNKLYDLGRMTYIENFLSSQPPFSLPYTPLPESRNLSRLQGSCNEFKKCTVTVLIAEWTMEREKLNSRWNYVRKYYVKCDITCDENRILQLRFCLGKNKNLLRFGQNLMKLIKNTASKISFILLLLISIQMSISFSN